MPGFRRKGNEVGTLGAEKRVVRFGLDQFAKKKEFGHCSGEGF